MTNPRPAQPTASLAGVRQTLEELRAASVHGKPLSPDRLDRLREMDEFEDDESDDESDMKTLTDFSPVSIDSDPF